MTRKPWPIFALALLQVMAPIGDWLVSAVSSHRSPLHFLAADISHYGLVPYFLWFWVPAILAGIAVYRVKPWSYPVFLVCLLLRSYQSVDSAFTGNGFGALWYNHPGGVLLWAFALLINLAIGAWFLLPRTRRPFLDRSVRWWEAAPRFVVNLDAQLLPVLDLKKGTSARILNLSRGGALLELQTTPVSKPNDFLVLGFRGTGSESDWIFSEAKAVHLQASGSLHRVGLTFCGMSPRSRKSLARLLKECRSLGLPQVRDETGFWQDLKYWLGSLRGQPQ